MPGIRLIYVFDSLIPVAIVGATQFYDTFVDVLSTLLYWIHNCSKLILFVGIIGYWSCVFAAIILTEHFIFRKGRFDLYDPQVWNQPSLLPPGLAALLAFLCAFAVVIPCMSQVWYTGPIADSGTGDIGILVGSGVAFILYVPLRCAERSMFGR